MSMDILKRTYLIPASIFGNAVDSQNPNEALSLLTQNLLNYRFLNPSVSPCQDAAQALPAPLSDPLALP